MYSLIEAIKETATTITFKAEHRELETMHTIEIQKDEIQKYLEYCGQNFIPEHKIANIMHEDITMDICQDIVKFNGEYTVLETPTAAPSWNASKMYHNAFRGQPYSNPSLTKFNLPRGYIMLDGYAVQAE